MAPRSPSRAFAGADNRPRIHLWRHPLSGRTRWSIGPVGNRSQAQFASPGEALNAALDHVGFQAAVVIVEGCELPKPGMPA